MEDKLKAYFYKKEQQLWVVKNAIRDTFGADSVEYERNLCAWATVREIMDEIGINEDDIPRYKGITIE